MSLVSLVLLAVGAAHGAKPKTPPGPLTADASAAKPADAATATDAAPVPDPEAFRAQPPGPGPESSWAPPVPESFVLSNGLKVTLIERHDLPLVSLWVLMDRGRTSTDKPGLPALTADLLDEGTKVRDGAAFAEAAASLGALIRTWQTDTGGARLDALSGEALLPSLDLLVEAIEQPSFAEFERVRKAEIDAIKAASAQPNWHAERISAAELFGPGHPYATLSSGTPETLSALKLKDVKKYHKESWQPGHFSIVVAGDVKRAEIEAALEERFGSWKAKRKPDAPAPPPPPIDKTRIVFREQPGAVQSVIRVVGIGPARTASDFLPTSLALTGFGGLFSSPLNMNLREEHGWAYGAYAWLSEAKDYGRLGAGASVQADKTAPSVQEILNEMREASQGKPNDELIALAKDSVRKSIAGDFETNAGAANSFASLVQYDLPLDTWKGWSQTVAAVPADAIGKASTLLDPAKKIIVVVGPRTVEADGKTVDVVKELEALGMPLTVVP